MDNCTYISDIDDSSLALWSDCTTKEIAEAVITKHKEQISRSMTREKEEKNKKVTYHYV